MTRRAIIGTSLGAIAAAAIALAVACGGSEQPAATANGTGTTPRFTDQPAAVPPQTDALKGEAVPGSASAASGGGATDGGAPSLPSTIDRKIISNTALGLRVEDVGGAFNEAGRLARVNGGYTEKSSFDAQVGKDSRPTSASLTLRVPASNYDTLLDALRGMPGATVASQNAQSTEITEQYTDLQSRLRNLERTEQSYLTLLQQAKSIQDILTVNDRLDSVRGQIEQIQGRLNVYDNLTDLATVSLTLTLPLPAQTVSDDGGPKSLQAAFEDAWAWSLDALRYAGAGGAVAAVAVVWLLIPLALVVVGARAFRRRGTAHPA